MKNINQVADLLNLTIKQLKNTIDPNRSHRAILDELGCHKEGNTYLFSEDGIRYIAYQYMNKNRECFYYIYPDKRPVILPDKISKKPTTVSKTVVKKPRGSSELPRKKPVVKKVIKNVKCNQS